MGPKQRLERMRYEAALARGQKVTRVAMAHKARMGHIIKHRYGNGVVGMRQNDTNLSADHEGVDAFKERFQAEQTKMMQKQRVAVDRARFLEKKRGWRESSITSYDPYAPATT